MLNGTVSFVKACQDFFTNGKYGRKIEISEFKELDDNDKDDLRTMLIELGYDVAPLKVTI